MSGPGELDADDLRFCVRTLERGSRSFAAAARLLPPDLLPAFAAYYAFCRVSDDLLDREGGSPAQAHRELLERLEAALAGEPSRRPEDRALAWVTRRYAIPRELPEALLEGYRWDAERRPYPCLASVLEYSARVAGSVGLALCLIMGVRERRALSRASELGIAMQLTNIARDVGEDGRRGRLYLPERWLAEGALSTERFLLDPSPSAPVREAVARLLSVADALYRRAEAGIVALPPRCRPSILAARRIYAAIGDEIARAGHDSVSRRARTSSARKLLLLGRSYLGGATHLPEVLEMPPLPAAEELVRAAQGGPSRSERSSNFIRLEGQIAE